MNNWSAGYVADIGYTFGYYAELNPLRIRLAFLNRGLIYPECGVACELGFGQGLSTNIHASASVTQWYGTDFNPSQAANAREFALQSGNQAHLYDESFAEFAARTDLPDFDFISLHGIWSWISDENRSVIVEFIRRKLKVGGVLYISYNTLPGWATFAPMRHLMTQHAEVISSEGTGIVSRIDNAIEFAEELIKTNPSYIKANPQVIDRVSKLKTQSRHYLAHEYFNKDWHPMHFATMADWLQPAKLTFAGSAHYLDHVETVNLTSDQQEFLTAISDLTFRESTRDFMVNQQFRRDYWVKGARQLSSLEQAEKIREQRMVMIACRSDVTLKVTGSLGEANMSPAIYEPILDVMADFKIRSVHQIEQQITEAGVSFAHLIQALMVLISQGVIAPAQDESIIAKAKKQTDKLNQHIFNKARSGNDIAYVASPVTGGGVMVPRFVQLFMQAYTQGKKKPEEWVEFAWNLLAAQNQKIIKDGKPLETPEENISELSEQAANFAEKSLIIMKALHVI